MKFICNFCNYSTDVKFCYEKHLIAKKHLEKAYETTNHTNVIPITYLNHTKKSEIHCGYCKNTYSNSSSLARHKKVCESKILLEKEHLSEIDNLKKELDYKNDLIIMLKSENAHLKSIVNNAGSIIKTSVSTMAYVIKNYKDAPVLESVKDYSAIHYEQDNTEFVDNLIYEQNHNKLHVYIGDFIIKTYKKEDPAQQSIWNSDTSRLTYLIREIITNNKVDWKIDKKGVKTNKFIIEPILEHIDTQVRDYIQNFDIDYGFDSAKEAERKMMKLKSGTDILKNIEDKILSDEILKYIAPYFYLSKNDE